MSWNVNVRVTDGVATVTKTNATPDGFFTISGHESDGNTTINSSATVYKTSAAV